MKPRLYKLKGKWRVQYSVNTRWSLVLATFKWLDAQNYGDSHGTPSN